MLFPRRSSRISRRHRSMIRCISPMFPCRSGAGQPSASAILPLRPSLRRSLPPKSKPRQPVQPLPRRKRKPEKPPQHPLQLHQPRQHQKPRNSTMRLRAVLRAPQTYMNESGRSAGEAARYFKIDPSRIVVFHDELDLLPGKVRVKTGGGNAGHNGLKSLTEHLGNDYRRVRIGIGHPGDKALVHNYVLSDFAKPDVPWVEALCKAIAANAGLLAKGEDKVFQNKIHQAMESAAPRKTASI